jgi:hypothetical protein
MILWGLEVFWSGVCLPIPGGEGRSASCQRQLYTLEAVTQRAIAFCFGPLSLNFNPFERHSVWHAYISWVGKQPTVSDHSRPKSHRHG